MGQKNRAWIELYKENLHHNVKQLSSLLPNRCRLMPAVKANAYGHGAVPISKMLEEIGINSFSVASVEEGIELREAGIQGDILVLSYTHPSKFEELLQFDLQQVAVDRAYAAVLQADGRRFKVHVGIDTGMHRLGERCENIDEICEIWTYSNLQIMGIFSHLCVSDGLGEKERAFTRLQIERFDHVAEELHRRGFEGFSRHLQGSYGILNYPELEYDYARPGIALYGLLCNGWDEVQHPVSLLPVMSLKTRVERICPLSAGEGAGYGLDFIAMRDSRIVALSIGYADGIPRNVTGQGYVLIGGHRAPIIGRICMDQMLADVTDIPEVRPGEEVVLIGQSGEECITGEMFAAWSGTITNEVFSTLGSRIERIYERV